jgi:three-Cys-motif partner protein
MSDDLLDDAEAHTLAKHRILQEYLKGWLPILGRGQNNRLLYFDGFAGCGELTQGHPGSPVVAIRTALEAMSSSGVPLEVKMVEREKDRCAYLFEIVKRERSDLQQLNHLIRVDDPICGECEAAVTTLLNQHAKASKQLGPAFFFLDQYGYAGFSMDLVRRILSHGMCETFSYLNWQRMHPYFTDPTKAETFTRALGGEEWRDVKDLRDQARVERFREIYVNALHARAGAKYVYDFAMRGADHRLIYWLFFSTNSLKGLEVMKKAMWKVDSTGRFEFSDRDANQGMLVTYTQSMLADDLDRQLRGREMTSAELREHVLTQTPEYRWNEAILL